MLPGRYIVAENTAPRTGGQPIIAPTKIVIEIGKFSSEIDGYPFNIDVHGQRSFDGKITLNTQTEAPILTFYTLKASGQYEAGLKSYAVAMQEGRDYAWLLGDVSDGKVSFMFPLNDINFPDGWYLGEWKCDDGTQFTFEGNKVSSNGHEIGTFTVVDDRITVTASDGSTDTMYAVRNPLSGALVITFNSGPDGMGENAGVFTNLQSVQKPAATTTTTNEPKMPTEFPPMPKVDLPAPRLNINGVWAANYNGKQFITQFQDGNYYGWIDGQPSEMGIIRIEGSTITGTNNHGVDFTAELELDATGKFLDVNCSRLKSQACPYPYRSLSDARFKR